MLELASEQRAWMAGIRHTYRKLQYHNISTIVNIIIMILPSSDSANGNIGGSSLSVVESVKKWFQTSWPFSSVKIDERNEADAQGSSEETTTAVVYTYEDECARVDDDNEICENIDRHCEEKASRGDDTEECHGHGAFRCSRNYEVSSALSSSLLDEQRDTDKNDKVASTVMDNIIKVASPKKYFLRNRQPRRKSYSFQLQLDDDKKANDVATSSSSNNHDDGGRMASTHSIGLNDSQDRNHIASTACIHDDRSKSNPDKVDTDTNNAPTQPQDTNATTQCSWTQHEIASLRKAYQQSNPTSTTLWHDIATVLNSERSASECQRMWFSLVATPKAKKRVGRGAATATRGRLNHAERQFKNEDGNDDEDEEEDDLFDSTPLKLAVQEIENDFVFQFQQKQQRGCIPVATIATTAKQQALKQDNNNTYFQSPNKKMMIKSPLSKRPRMFSPKNSNKNRNSSSSSSNVGGKYDTVLSPLINRRKGYNTYVNNLRKEMNRAQKAKTKGGDKTNNDGGTRNNDGSCCNYSGRDACGNFQKGGSGNATNKGGSSRTRTIRIKEGKGNSQLTAELVDGMFAWNIPHEDSNGDNGSDVDVFEEVFRLEDEENEFA